MSPYGKKFQDLLPLVIFPHKEWAPRLSMRLNDTATYQKHGPQTNAKGFCTPPMQDQVRCHRRTTWQGPSQGDLDHNCSVASVCSV